MRQDDRKNGNVPPKWHLYLSNVHRFYAKVEYNALGKETTFDNVFSSYFQITV